MSYLTLARTRPALRPFLSTARCVRHLPGEPSTTPFSRSSSTSTTHPQPTEEEDEPIERPPQNPWFLRGPGAYRPASSQPTLPSAAQVPPPEPGCPPLVLSIHAHLSSLPQLDPLTLYAGPPLPRPYNPEVEYRPAQGKRRRGGRPYAGEGFGDFGQVWRWVVVAQVREGTEGRGSVEAVVRSTRNALIKLHPTLKLPPRSRREAHDGWQMLDLGDTAVHILSRTAREKWFSDKDMPAEVAGGAGQRAGGAWGGMPFWFPGVPQ